MESLKDLIYFDIEKAKSLISQLNEGLISEISRAVEDESEDNAGLGFDVKIIKGNLGEKSREKTIKTEKISLYHEMLNSIEANLSNNKLLTHLNEKFGETGLSFNDFMEEIPNYSYIKAAGWGGFEDFERFKRILSNFNDIQRLIYESQLLENPELIALQEQLANAKKAANLNNERNIRAKELAKIKAIEKNLDRLLKEETEIHLFDEGWIEKVKTFLDTFSPNRLNFRLLPLDDFSEFQILANLKAKYMLDGSFENTIFTYGSKPNIKLTILGIITSCPRREDIRVNHSDEFLAFDESELSDESHFDKAFRNVFDSFEAFEKFFFVPNYPKIAISPIAIYREVKIKGNTITT
ncbi:DUF6414 family protein [Prolixibacter denitrificans]|uniref:Uncharacterized protein n=1 Tax=Prolixibacter denitrificans TaxID=1541063 RepID=A0A2P8CFT4_9BACT|nr:hypothetical protein [Prolixibacter denitrificans]PSK83828.1 hypothetical protein CLV93_103244 [Prolixibacter denitrificans]GET23370.1 hypothetical protein JCM18694_36160 [Prolixibacter denitrificans]